MSVVAAFVLNAAAITVTGLSVETGVHVIGKLTLRAPAGTIIFAGIVTYPVTSLVRETTTPGGGAKALSFTDPVVWFGAVDCIGIIERDST